VIHCCFQNKNLSEIDFFFDSLTLKPLGLHEFSKPSLVAY
jgi:hypothetical protein